MRGSPLKACRRLASIAKQKQRSFFSFGFRLTSAVGKCVGERGGGAALFAKKSDYANETNLTESRRIEKVESAESFAESNAESYKDSSDSIESNHKIDCHEFNKLNSRNDDSVADSHALTLSSLAMTNFYSTHLSSYF